MPKPFKFCVHSLLWVTFLILMSQCSGGVKCGPGLDPLTDADSDCIADSSDNCPLVFNPAQTDTDDDGAGSSCDPDDNDAAVGPSTLVLQQIFSSENSSQFVVHNQNHQTQCTAYLLSCHNTFLGLLNADGSDEFSIANPKSYGDQNSLLSILNPQGLYSQTGLCSAFDDSALSPPAIHCLDDTNKSSFGFLSTNPNLPNAIHPCDLFIALGLEQELCLGW